ncbi:bifunctional 2-polyprenyl-6-hydroxyphenol methylase/3-demethylubiquinol 3-O-methyltransferase UbiG [uncultured Prochlorococcus sp.]|uniref:class I SAM-dependent methyltransferase n=1 Tax=uncultured Prochlorococcus sp. TaxID=159733 RepID=UPI00258F1118|nr:methyltransferase domain-containing protein [uncultured Prochlorococcus sp.]
MKKNNLIISEFLDDAFNLKSHLVEFLSIKECDLEGFLENAKMNLANLHPGDVLGNVSDFYTDIVGDRHLADLAAWHITSKDYIADTLKLQQRFSRDLVLDFGGGIGTHALANAMSSNIKHVFFVDINQTNRKFVEFRAKKLGVENKLTFCRTIKETNIKIFDTIVCLDVLEHLADPASQIEIFYEIMHSNSIALFNWYFYKGEKNEYPFHIDDSLIVENFFEKLQSKFLEVFHPILITTRAYKKFK